MSTENRDETIARLTESNRRLANQIVGYGDRMQQTIAGIRKDAKVEALREAADELSDMPGAQESHINWLRAHADVVEAS